MYSRMMMTFDDQDKVRVVAELYVLTSGPYKVQVTVHDFTLTSCWNFVSHESHHK